MKALNERLARGKEPEPEGVSEDIQLLREIRDALQQQRQIQLTVMRRDVAEVVVVAGRGALVAPALIGLVARRAGEQVTKQLGGPPPALELVLAGPGGSLRRGHRTSPA
jgi:hypothetical protein